MKHIHKNWWGKKITWIMNEICSTGKKVQYSDTAGNNWVKEEKIYQCPKCKKIEVTY